MMAGFLKSWSVVRLATLVSSEIGLNYVQRRAFKPRWVAPTLKELKRRKDIDDERNGGPKIFHRSTFLEWNYDAEIYAFNNRLGEKLDETLLRTALTHKSYIVKESKRLNALGMENQLNIKDNTELVEKGSKLISKFVKGYLRATFKHCPEELILSVHDYLTGTPVLSHVAKHIGLSDIILCEDFPCEETTLAKSLEAVVACLEQSSGEERARLLVQDIIIPQLYGKDVNELWYPSNPMGILASILAREGRGQPEPRLIRKAGSETILAVYHVGIFSDRSIIGTGAGESVDIAQEMAARDALKRLFQTEDSMKALPFGRQLKSSQEQIKEAESRANLLLQEWTSEKSYIS